MKKFFIPLVTMVLSGSATIMAAQSQYTAISTLDNTVLEMGRRTTLNVEFAGPISEDYTLVDTALTEFVKKYPDVEIFPEGSPIIKDIGNGRKQFVQKYLVQPFDSGLYVIPSAVLISGGDTVFTNTPALKVEPTEIDTALLIYDDKGNAIDLKIHDFTDIATVEKKIIDYVPDWVVSWGWWILLSIILIGVAVFVYVKWLRHGRIPLMPAKRPIPPYELAMSELSRLREMQLWQKGSEKEYYTRLTDILRRYIHGRFDINAREMTTSQLMSALKHCEEPVEGMNLMDEILRQADFVKFAKARPLADDNEQAYTQATRFVEITRPIEPVPENENSQKDKNDTNNEQNVK